MLVAAPVTYTITGLFQDLRGILGEMSTITEKPAEPFWVLYRQLARSIADQYGAGNAIGVIIDPLEVQIIHEKYVDPTWELTLWPTEHSTPVAHLWHAMCRESTIDTVEGGDILQFIPHVRMPAHDGLPDHVQIYLWLCSTVYTITPPLPVETPDVYRVSMMIICADSDTYHRVDLGVQGVWKYRDFASALVGYLEIVPVWKDIISPIVKRVHCVR